MNTSYITSLQLDSTEVALGNALFGICNTYASTSTKIVSLPAFDTIEPGIQINIKFTEGSNVTSNANLKVGSANTYPVRGACVCAQNEILSFVFEEVDANTQYWRMTGHVVLASDTTPTAVGTTAAVGTSEEYARSDHTHAISVSAGQEKGQIIIAGQTYTIPGVGGQTYGICYTVSGAEEKILTLSEFTLTPGVTLQVKFIYSNNIAAALNVNDTGAYPLVQIGASGWETTIWAAGAILTLTFDGESWIRDHTMLSSAGQGPVTTVNFNPTTRVLSYSVNNGAAQNIVTFGELSMLDRTDVVNTAIFTQPFDMLYVNSSRQPTRLPANTSTTRKFLRMIGTTVTNPQTNQVSNIGTEPVWDTITAVDIGLENLVNTLQVTDVSFNDQTGAVTVTVGNGQPTTLFTLGANAFLSAAYLPLTGGTMTGSLEFASATPAIIWNSTTPHRIVETNNGFQLQEQRNNDWIDLLAIDNSAITATTFVGALTGNASSASALTATTTNALHTLNGIVGFSGSGEPWANQSWVGLQIGAGNIKLQIAQNEEKTLIRSNTGSTWTNWATLLTERDITSGDANGQIKVGTTNINVTGLGALAFLDSVDVSQLDLSSGYVTLTTAQSITGTKTFSNIIATLLTIGDAAISYDDTSDTLLISWTNNVHQFTANGYSTTGYINPSTANTGTVGTAAMPWASMYATSFNGALVGNADTATRATSDANGLQIDTSYLKLSGGTMQGVITTQYPINQVLTGGSAAAALKVSETCFPSRWTFNKNITPTNGDIITIETPGVGHEYGVFLSLDNGAHTYPITLTEGSIMTTEYPAGSYLTLIFDSNNSAFSIYSATGSTARTTITNGTWRVINYYDSGAPYGVRVYKENIASLNDYYPLIIGRTTVANLSNDANDNIYGMVGMVAADVPSYNPYYGIISAPIFKGRLDGNASTASAFDTGATVTLTGHVTGVSTASTKNWTVDVTIANNVITDNMVLGGISRTKLEDGVVKVFNKSEVLINNGVLDFDNYTKNGLIFIPSSSDMLPYNMTMDGTRPSSQGTLLNLQTVDRRAALQILGNDGYWYIRGYGSDTNHLNSYNWRPIVVENITGDTARVWDISISGTADKATHDADGNIITTYYATSQYVENLLALKDALVFKGTIVEQSAANTNQHKYNNLPQYGYSAGDTYKVATATTRRLIENDINTPLVEPGDLIIAIHDGPASSPGTVTVSDWTIVQSNLETPVSGPNLGTADKGFAIYDGTSGRYLDTTGAYMTSLGHYAVQVQQNSSVGHLDGFKIFGATLSAATDLISNRANQLSYGDSGPQIQFEDAGDSNMSLSQGVILYNGHSGDSGMDATFNFLANSETTALKANAFVAKDKVAIGQSTVDLNKALYVVGDTSLNGNFEINGTMALDNNNTGTYKFQIDATGGRFRFLTSSNPSSTSIGQFEFGNTVYINGNILPLHSNTYTIGINDTSVNPANFLSWSAVYIGNKASYGSNNQGIYWNNGVPTPITYTANRIYAPIQPSNANDPVVYIPTRHFIDNDSISIGDSSKHNDVALYVGGDVVLTGKLSLGDDIMPSVDNTKSLGSDSLHWSALYVGSANSYGDEYTPVYWNNGVPAATKIIQKKNFTFNNTTTATLNNTAYSTNTIVLQIVVTSGKENMTSPIGWEAGAGSVTLTMTSNPRGNISGYILTARGVDLDQEVTNNASTNE